jgi:hypothetical protein
MGGFRIGRTYAKHTYPESRGVGEMAGKSALVWGALELGGEATTVFLPPGIGTPDATDDLRIAMPFAAGPGRGFTALAVIQNNAGSGVGATITYTLLINGSPTILTVTMTLDQNNGSVFLLPAQFVQFGALDQISIQAVIANLPDIVTLPTDITVTAGVFA